MEPQLPSPQLGPEHAPVGSERRTSPLESPLTSSESAPERQETRERQSFTPTEPPAQPAAPPSLPQITPIQSDNSSSQQADDKNPAIAADEDLIEKEWVEKAKQVIAQTKHDPYLQEQAVSKLQADYLQKRYNKQVKLPSESA